jgi:putative membrane protein
MGTCAKLGFVFGISLAASAAASAHETTEAITLASWTWPLPIVLPVFLSIVLYSIGLLRMSRRKSRAGISRASVLCFFGGWLSLVFALDSPIHELGEQLFWVHMSQHEILVLISAPLLLLGHPLLVLTWTLPQNWRVGAARFGKHWILDSLWSRISAPLAAWCIHAAALWIWHAPLLFDATLRSDAMHAAQHLSFFGSALLFWWPLAHRHGGRLGYGAAGLYVFTTAVHTSVLGALLTFSGRPWYPPYALTAPAWGLTALEDQQLGGLIMWIPAGTVLLGITLFLFAHWMRHSERRWQLTRTAALLQPVAPVAPIGDEDRR